MNVFLSSSTEATCGKTSDHPWYGKTRLGWQMRRGIVAVDPAVINLLSEVYVPGYGLGIAADTGGLIIGRHIDLGYDVDDFEMWFWWGTAYVLTPPPPPDEIRWILPDFPRGRWP
jgi:3D (Asp-Asp-Asp) domain-containing protein